MWLGGVLIGMLAMASGEFVVGINESESVCLRVPDAYGFDGNNVELAPPAHEAAGGCLFLKKQWRTAKSVRSLIRECALIGYEPGPVFGFLDKATLWVEPDTVVHVTRFELEDHASSAAGIHSLATRPCAPPV